MKTIWLGQCDGRRDNNFTIIRLLLTWLVLFGHSFAVTKSGLDPITSGLRPRAQLMVWSGQGGYVNAALATPFVFALATLSWFLVERPALRMKNVIDRRLAFLDRSIA